MPSSSPSRGQRQDTQKQKEELCPGAIMGAQGGAQHTVLLGSHSHVLDWIKRLNFGPPAGARRTPPDTAIGRPVQIPPPQPGDSGPRPSPVRPAEGAETGSGRTAQAWAGCVRNSARS